MTREIKFRAWDKSRKYMLPIFDSVAQSSWFIPNWKDNFDVMQYTGLKDRNGVEIYESDIVSEDDMLSVCAFVQEVAAYAFIPVEILDKSWSCLFEEYGIDTFFRNDIPGKYVEVIGNKFENPELIK